MGRRHLLATVATGHLVHRRLSNARECEGRALDTPPPPPWILDRCRANPAAHSRARGALGHAATMSTRRRRRHQSEARTESKATSRCTCVHAGGPRTHPPQSTSEHTAALAPSPPHATQSPAQLRLTAHTQTPLPQNRTPPPATKPLPSHAHSTKSTAVAPTPKQKQRTPSPAQSFPSTAMPRPPTTTEAFRRSFLANRALRARTNRKLAQPPTPAPESQSCQLLPERPLGSPW